MHKKRILLLTKKSPQKLSALIDQSKRSLKGIKEKLREFLDIAERHKLKKQILTAIPFWIGAGVTGLVALAYAGLFSLAEQGTSYLFGKAGWIFFILTPLAFMTARWLVFRFAPFSRGSGIPQIMASLELSNPNHFRKLDRLLNFRIIAVKILSSIIMVFGGGAIGREGPTIQIGGAIFNKINDILPENYPKISRRSMIITGAASGLAAAFNTPLGGIVFAIEEITKTHFSLFKSALFTGVIISGLTALSLSGPYLYLGYPKLTGISVWMIFVVILISVITGVAGGSMGRLIEYILKKLNWLGTSGKKLMYAGASGLI